jgi:hypothetical protein
VKFPDIVPALDILFGGAMPHEGRTGTTAKGDFWWVVLGQGNERNPRISNNQLPSNETKRLMRRALR